MGQIRLLVVVGPDLPEDGGHYLATVLQHLEWEWFRVTVAGEPDLLPAAAPLDGRVPLRPGRAWFSGGRELARLRTLSQAADLIDCHGYQALAYAARAGLDPSRTVYTRHYLPDNRSARQREAWLMGRVAAVFAPRPDLAASAGPRARLVPITHPGGRPAPQLEPLSARTRLGLDAAAPVAAVLVDASCEVTLAEELAVRHPEVQWLALRGRLGTRAATAEPLLSVQAADVVLFPVREELDDAGLLDGALALGRAVMAARVPGVVGRFRCLTEGYLLPAGAVETWDEVLSALLDDRELRRVVAEGARRAYGPGGPGQEVRVLESQYAGVLMAATGTCPVCM